MSRSDTLALVNRYYAAFNAGDRSGMLACLADDVVHDINQGGSEHGKPAFAAFMVRMDRCYRERLAGITVMASEDGLNAAAEFTVHGEYLVADEGLPPARGQRYVLPAGAFLAVRRGHIARVTMYYNLGEWIRQVSQ